jgi:hypothetical protein
MARPRGEQQGQLKLRGGSWILKYYEDRIVDGNPSASAQQQHWHHTLIIHSRKRKAI